MMTLEQFQLSYGENAPCLESFLTVADAATDVPELQTVALQFLEMKSLLEQHLHQYGIQWER